VVHPRRPRAAILFIIIQEDGWHQTLGSAGGPRTTPPLGCTCYRDNLLQDQALSFDDNSLLAIWGEFSWVESAGDNGQKEKKNGSSTPICFAGCFSFAFSPRSTALPMMGQASSQLIRRIPGALRMSHAFITSIARRSKSAGNLDLSSAQAPPTCFTPCTGHLTRGTLTWRNVLNWHLSRYLHTRSKV